MLAYLFEPEFMMHYFVFATHAVTSHGEWVTPQTAERQDYDSLFCIYCKLRIVVHIEPLTGTKEFVHLPGFMGNVSKLNSCRFNRAETIPEQTPPTQSLAALMPPGKLQPGINTKIQNWYCCWCHISWYGEKMCPQCQYGVYTVRVG